MSEADKWRRTFEAVDEFVAAAPITNAREPVAEPPVVVVSAGSYPQVVKFAFARMTYGEYVKCILDLLTDGHIRPPEHLQLVIRKRLWRWANEDTNNN